jgi:DNA-binding GntR family transcriptional regulator
MTVEDIREAPASRSAVGQVVNGVLELLERGKIVPGQRLVEVDLCERFGVGRNSVREAFQRLASYGVIEIKRNKGAMIRDLTIDEAFDILEVNQALTALTARVAARAVGRGADTRRLKTALDAVSVAQAGGDDSAITSAVREFQLAELQVVDNDELRRYLTSMHVHALRAHFFRHVYRWLYADIRGLGEAILASDEVRAEAYGRSFIGKGIRILRNSTQGLPGSISLTAMETFLPLPG